MSKKIGSIQILGQNAVPAGEKAAKVCLQGLVRRKLADISNFPQKSFLPIPEGKSQSVPLTAGEYIHQLQQENMALKKCLVQRNKLIEQSGIELERMRINLLKVQEQNKQLALHNNQMLADLNSGKDQLKLLRHEIGCKNAMLAAKQLEVQEQGAKTCKTANSKSTKCADEDKPRNPKRSLQPNAPISLEEVQSKENPENKRPCVRRQSARFKAVEPKPTEEVFEIDEAKLPPCPSSDGSVPQTVSTSLDISAKTEDDEKVDSEEIVEKKRPSVRRQSTKFRVTEPKPVEDLLEMDDNDDKKKASASENETINIEENKCDSEPQEVRRSSPRRPSRVAARMVQSYKEVPLNIKMRRAV